MSSTTAADDAPLRGRSALISGGSRGIGRECARRLGRAGASLVLLGRDRQALAAVANELGGSVTSIVCDFANATQVDEIAADLRFNNVLPDILINNAGQFFLAPMEQTSVEDFERIVRVNLTSHFALMRAFLPAMRARGSGDVVTIGSIADVRPLEGNAAYSASKFGLRGLHGVLREETRGTGIRATLVSPGRVDTEIWSGIDAGERSDVGPRAGMIAAEEVADAVLYVVTRPRSVNIDELRLSRA